MAFEQHQEKKYPKDAQSIFQAALKVTEKFLILMEFVVMV